MIQEKDDLPAFVRELAPAIKYGAGSAKLCYPQSPSGVFFVTVENDQIGAASLSKGSYNWSYQPKSRVISTQNVIRDPRPVCRGKDGRAVLSL